MSQEGRAQPWAEGEESTGAAPQGWGSSRGSGCQLGDRGSLGAMGIWRGFGWRGHGQNRAPWFWGHGGGRPQGVSWGDQEGSGNWG